MTTKTCSVCRRRFECGHGKPGCWCERVNVPVVKLKEIERKADDCLCRHCLESYAGDES